MKELDTEALLKDADALILDATFPEAQIHLAELAKRQGIPVIFGSNHLSHGVGELVSLCDVFIASERLATELAPRGELQDSLVELQRLGPQHVILTLGRDGCMALSDDLLIEQPAFEINVVDNGNAGDVFHGAFTAFYAQEKNVVNSIKIAAAAAALSCQAHGALAGIPSPEDLENFVQKR